MTTSELRLQRAALKLLHGIGVVGMTREIFALYLRDEVADSATLSDQTIDDLLASLHEKGWVRSYTNPVTEQLRWILTQQGEGARVALG